ncbi:MAG: hypothetical protein J5819_06260 [Eubacterium sp.]|nr:hypothetical protein [Eubacterium sp.]
MNYQRSKAPLSLMEQLIMVLVFAFAAAVCLQAFVYSDNLSKSGTAREMAATRATEVAEVCKAYRGDFEQAAAKIDGTVVPTDGGNSIEKTYTEDGLRVVLDTPATETITADTAFQKAKVSVWEIPDENSQKKQDDGPIYTLTVAWQTAGQSK